MKLFRKKKELKHIHWGDITIAQHKKILDLCKDGDDDIMYLYQLTAIAYNKPMEWIEGMKISEANNYANTLAFINEKPKPKTAKGYYTLNGHRYKTTMNLQEVNTAQYLDFQQLADKSREMPAEFLSIILIPEGKKYNEGYDLQTVVSDIENYMTVEEAFGLTAFFFNLLQISMRLSLRKLKRLERKARKEGLMTNEQLEALSKVRESLESASGMRQWMQ